MTFRPLVMFVDHLRARMPMALAVLVLGLGARLAAPPPPSRSADAIARMLGDAVAGGVTPDDFVWEERGGFLHDALLGRRVLFLAAPDDGLGAGNADLYRARVRLTRSGRPISLHAVRNLTATPLGDDRGLVARGRRVAFTTSAFGAVQGVSLLDLGGDQADRQAWTAGERLRADVESWLETGSFLGVSRAEITFDEPPKAARLDLADDALVMALGPEALPAALDARTGELNTGGRNTFGARAQRIPRAVRSFAEVAELSAARLFGPGAARAIDRLALGVRRLAAPWRAAPETVPPGLDATQVPAEPALPGAQALWPPPPLAPALDPPLPGEGVWAAVADPFARPGAPAAGGPDAQALASTPFVATFLRPDPARPRARVHLLAVDTRRIELRLQTGYDAPRPAIGPRGTGRLPEGPLASRVLGAFGVGARSAAAAADTQGDAGALGTVVDGRVLAPARPGAATLAVDRHGRAFFGAWPSGADVPRSIDALWQSPALFDRAAAARDDGAIGLPSSDGDGLVAERAALCATARGFVIHAWSSDIDAAGLGAALARAGCEAGLSLGRTPAPLGFAFLSRRDDGGFSSARLSPAMSLSPERIVAGSPDAFIYLVSRDPAPTAPLADNAAWAPDGGGQPHPAWLPAVYTVDVVHLGASVHISAFSPDRFAFRLRAGSREVSPRGAAPLSVSLPADEQGRVLAAIGVGTGRRRGPRGLAVGGVIGLRFRGEGGLLLLRGGRVEIRAAAPIELTADTDATELPLTADDAKLRPESREIGSMRRRSAACVLDDGTLLVAATTFDSDEATTEALLDLGCIKVVALDRGTHRNAFVHRTGGEQPPEPTYEETALFAVGSPMPGRARRLTAGAPP
jgi:hypothetical protein